MANSTQSATQHRSTTDFPRRVDHLSRTDLETIYFELRQSHKSLAYSQGRYKSLYAKTRDQLHTESRRLQEFVHKLALEQKGSFQLRNESEDLRQVRATLETELKEMSQRFDGLASAFDGINSSGGRLTMLERFGKLYAAVRDLLLWWRDDDDPGLPAAKPNPQPQSPAGLLDSNEDDARILANSPANIQKALRDD